MKIKQAFYISFLLISMIFVSCVSSGIDKENSFSEDSAAYALKTALTTAAEQATEKLSGQLDSMDFIPQNYKILKTEMKSIPGMSTLISAFNHSVSDHLKRNMMEFRNYTMELAETTQFNSPVQMVFVSDTSASEKFLEENRIMLSFKLKEILDNADFSDFISCVNHYNSYVATQNNSYNNLQKLQLTSISSEIADIVCERFSKLLTNSEELYRTTPDPYADEIAAVVFGIN